MYRNLGLQLKILILALKSLKYFLFLIFGLDVLIDDIDDFYSMVKIQESRQYVISITKLNKFDLIRESLLFFEINPLSCKLRI